MPALLQDLRYTLGQIARSPGFALVAVLTLAIGIGANAAIFSSMDAVVLHPLAVPGLDRVMTVAEQQNGGAPQWVALANYEDWKRRNRSFESMGVYRFASMSTTGGGEAAHVSAARISANFFDLLRARPLLGRVFVEGECRPGRDAVVVLSYGFWQRQFGGSPDALGRTIELDQRTFGIVGVLPKTMQFPASVDVFLPLAATPQQLADRTGHDYLVIGRLRRGVSASQARAEMRDVTAQLDADYPATNHGWGVSITPLLDNINGDPTPRYYRLILGATLFLLLVVCANVAILQFARGIARRPEIALRMALGASRWRVLRQLLMENLLLALIGAGGGILFAQLYLHVLLITMPDRVARHLAGWDNTSLNGRALAFTLALAVVAGVVAGLTPALEALRVDLVEQLKSASRSATGAARVHRLRNIFATLQIALAVALVIGAALMTKGMGSMLRAADGLDPAHLLTFRVSLPLSRYDSARKQAQWYRQALEKLRVLPGVRFAEVTTALPYSDAGWLDSFAIENRPAMPGNFQAALRPAVSAGYFRSLHIPIFRGRGFTASDATDSLPVAVVSRRLAERYFPNQNPIGQRVRLGAARDSREPWLRIVGVAAEAQYGLWNDTPQLVIYTSTEQSPPLGATFALRTGGDPLALSNAVRRALATIDPALPLDNIETYAAYQRESLIGLVYAASMLAGDAVIALLLAAIGIFAVMANLAAERTREIGLRMAMGARRGDVLAMLLSRASRLIAFGLLIGLAMAFALAHLAASLLVGVRPSDPLVFSSIPLAVAAVSLLASWLPARRAARVDPMTALRDE